MRSKCIGLLLAAAWQLGAEALRMPLNKLDGLELRGVKATVSNYQGIPCLNVTGKATEQELTLARIKNISLRDGTIEIDVAGAPGSGAMEGARGFVGIAFRVGQDAKQFEYIYLRPSNGRAPDQVRRNHSVQYASHPDFPWSRLRKEEPEKYETYADLETGAWTKIRIVVSGKHAQLYVRESMQPTLVVNDLKLKPEAGGIALWVGPGTDAHFANLTISKTD